MRGSREARLPNFFRKLLFLAVFLALFCLLPVIAQKAQGNDTSAPKYDPHTETKMKGTVEEVKKLTPISSRKDFGQRYTSASGNSLHQDRAIDPSELSIVWLQSLTIQSFIYEQY